MKICFWGNISSALRGEPSGGGELQTAMLAKALAKAGHDVVIVDPNCPTDYESPEGIKLVSVPRWNAGIIIIRMFFHRIPGLYSALYAQKAEVYYVRIRGFYNIVPFLVARKLGSKFVMALASDLDVEGFLGRLKSHYLKSMSLREIFTQAIPTEIVLPHLLRNADIVLCQHEIQQQLLEKRKIKSHIVRNIIDVRSDNLSASKHSENRYIYVGSLDVRKGFDLFVRVVEAIADATFIIVGNARGRGSQELINQLQRCPNTEMLGRLSRGATIRQMETATALICTSRNEGFPNIFLEAWSVGTPVVSLLVDPGNVIQRHGLGIVCNGDLQELINVLRRRDLSINRAILRNYVRQYHDSDRAVQNFLSIVNDLPWKAKRTL